MLNKIYGILNNIIIRLVVYYLAWLLALGGIFHLFPQILIYVSQERERVQGRERLFEGEQGDLEKIKEGVATLVEGNIKEVLLMVTFVDPARTIPVMVALAMAFWVTLPITWLYRWTRPREKYSQSFAHTLLVIPIAISLVVFLVKDSIALAFSLAGIVAAVRFRTSLEEPMDSVYMLMAIGIGLAAGTQLILVAYLASVVFVIVTLGVWKSNFGAQPEILSGWRIDDSRKWGTGPGEGDIATENLYNAQIEVYTTKVNVAKKSTVQILESSTKRWQVANVVENPDRTAIVVFDVWLKKSVTLPSFIQDIEENGRGCINDVKLKGQELGRGIIAHAESRK
ncbi:hypothetical protein C6503_16400 [Candidatus Poribacteria bacterium]|nr:MAG: hypothetical protein C6503_16400 [Candidatus Poribacteria bacterium]